MPMFYTPTQTIGIEIFIQALFCPKFQQCITPLGLLPQSKEKD
jgi:hypothetical protein